MQINKEVLKSFDPCVSRYKNYLEHYSEFNGSFDEFLDLDKIAYSDKIWVARKVLNKNQLVHFGLMCAESVLFIFEEKYPEDKRIGDCIRYLKSIPDYSNMAQEQRAEALKHRNAAYAATTTATATAAYAYAYAATAAAADAYAYAATAYATAAATAAAAAATVAAAAAATAATAADARKNQEKLNVKFLKMASSL